MAEMTNFKVNVDVTTRPSDWKEFGWRVLTWFPNFFEPKKPNSMKRLTIFMAATVLCYSAIRLTHAAAHSIWWGKELPQATVALLVLNYGILAVMAGVAYFKKDAQGNFTVESLKRKEDEDEPADKS